LEKGVAEELEAARLAHGNNLLKKQKRSPPRRRRLSFSPRSAVIKLKPKPKPKVYFVPRNK
jgi:hypothetical protein